MPRPCIICDNDLTKYVREKAQEGKSPATIRKMINAQYGLDVKAYQLRYHTKTHDPLSGTVVLTKRSVDKKMRETEQNLQQSRNMLDSMMSFMDKVMGFQQLLDPDEFKKMSEKDKISAINQTTATMVKLKKLEMEQQKLDREQNPVIEEIGRLASRVKTHKKVVQHAD